MHTVIVGAGFAGVKAALEVSKRQLGPITLIADEPYFLHHATLYATATGRSSLESVIPLEDIFSIYPDITILHTSMTSLNPHKKVVNTPKKDVHYDELIIAIGMVTSYFGITGMAKHSYGLKTLPEVEQLRDHVKNMVISGKESNFVIVGAGPTGVELAGSLQEYIGYISTRYAAKRHATRVHIVEAANRILPKSSPRASAHVKKRLKALGVTVHEDTKVSNVNSSQVTIGNKHILSQTVVWTAGVTNHPFFAEHSDIFTLDAHGQVVVDEHLMALPHVYVLGDNAASKHGGMAWTAIENGKFIADHLARVMTLRHYKPYIPPHTPQSFPVGDNWAYTEWRGGHYTGKIGYLLRRAIEFKSYKDILPKTLAVAAWKSHSIRLDDQT